MQISNLLRLVIAEGGGSVQKSLRVSIFFENAHRNLNEILLCAPFSFLVGLSTPPYKHLELSASHFCVVLWEYKTEALTYI